MTTISRYLTIKKERRNKIHVSENWKEISQFHARHLNLAFNYNHHNLINFKKMKVCRWLTSERI